ncbi:hypothetical protein NLG97_g10301 [Lecanicillium saksenae]|uniref:Uncharacterized protein n=1 Tax=Lecanicillium saksenae TaxID=468837 RepID=A0ACC1QHI6_9HYPO|nr:hypothetical protein NLG97_g10301 [Lecanicillium saksenae]
MATEVEMPISMMPMNQGPESSSPGSTAPGSATKQTPSPSASASGQSSAGLSKRPPRKSTLTQQQKNQKRQRATQDQLATLEVEFNKNPTPTANVRERIAEEINMTERSVQIWFQNRRAKIKLLAKKSLETGEDIDSIPESMRAYLAMQAMESGKSLGGSYLGRTGLVPFGHGNMLLGEQAGPGKVLIHHLTCRSLSIGKWTRVGQNMMDLIIFYSPDKCTMTYYINNEQAGYKIEYPFAYIKNIYLENNEGDPSKLGGIVIELNHAPNFFMDSPPSAGGFYQVGDFTEDSQASNCMIHHLGGNDGMALGRTESGGGSASRSERPHGESSDGRPIVAVFADNSRVSRSKLARFHFLGAGATNEFGEEWAMYVTMTALRIWEMMMNSQTTAVSAVAAVPGASA